MKKSEKQICPKCRGTDIQTDFSNPGKVATGHFINTKKCNKCGHVGTFFPIIEKRLKYTNKNNFIQKELKKY